jgi:VIT1/CCC1 family predicted Fe2+/Mn2+ transporter
VESRDSARYDAWGDAEGRVTDETAARSATAARSDPAAIAARLDDERRRASTLGEVREAIFGAQDGLVSTLAVVSTVSGATSDRFPVLVAGIAAALAGIFSMAAGEYLSSKSQRQIVLAQLLEQRERVATQRTESQAELAYLFTEEGLPPQDAAVIAAVIGRHPEVLLTTKAAKEFGISLDETAGSPLQGAMVMGIAFGLGALAPILPYLILPIGVATAVAVAATGAVLFLIGVAKTRWTGGNPLASGAEILLVGAVAGIVGNFFGSVLPALLGAPVAAA